MHELNKIEKCFIRLIKNTLSLQLGKLNEENGCLFLCYILVDIQEFYELTLLDDSKTIQQKTVETLQIASKWEQDAHAAKMADVSMRI